ncbi:hypothetical protein RB195_023495 [Necator americanus]|uniref:Uncharacterized protein n=1 Tax=Necator americanus TaxID=51031 RepID=A0ABR1EKB1_NECAM
MRSDATSVTLSSGLHLLPTRLGYLVSVKPVQARVNQLAGEELEKWDQYWLMDISIHTTASPEPPKIPEEQEKFKSIGLWTMLIWKCLASPKKNHAVLKIKMFGENSMKQ